MASEPRIRPARPDDAARIAATLRDLGWFEQINTESVEATTQRVAEQLALCAANDDHTAHIPHPDWALFGIIGISHKSWHYEAL
jgi:hypothetical protein